MAQSPYARFALYTGAVRNSTLPLHFWTHVRRSMIPPMGLLFRPLYFPRRHSEGQRNHFRYELARRTPASHAMGYLKPYPNTYFGFPAGSSVSLVTPGGFCGIGPLPPAHTILGFGNAPPGPTPPTPHPIFDGRS